MKFLLKSIYLNHSNIIIGTSILIFELIIFAICIFINKTKKYYKNLNNRVFNIMKLRKEN